MSVAYVEKKKKKEAGLGFSYLAETEKRCDFSLSPVGLLSVPNALHEGAAGHV